MSSKEVLESATRQIRDHFQETAAGWIDEMVPLAAVQAGLRSQELRRRITVRESVSNTRLNATTKRLGDGTFAVELNAGLTLLANRLADLFVAHLGFMGPTGEPIEGRVINEAEFQAELRELLATYWSNDRLYRPFHLNLAPCGRKLVERVAERRLVLPARGCGPPGGASRLKCTA